MSTFRTITVGAHAIDLGPVTLPAEHDPASGTVVVRLEGRAHRIRPWTFGERRRLLDQLARDRTGVDVASVVAMAARTLVSPAPGPDGEVALGIAALAWSAGGGAGQPAPPPGVDAAEQAVAVAGATGWDPAAIDVAAAADVDRWFAAVAPGADAEREDDGFVRFRLES